MTDEEKKQELEDILSSGVASISVGEKSISYKDNIQLAQALERLKSKTRIVRSVSVNPYFDKGL